MLGTARISIIDDSHVDRLLIGGLLKSTQVPYEILSYENPRAALDALLLAPTDLVITDMIMPDMDGFEVVREMRSRLPRVPVILMTAYGNESIAVRALEAGAASYVPKSRQAELLADTVQRVLARSQAEQWQDIPTKTLDEMLCKFTLDNDPSLIPPLVNWLQSYVGEICISDPTERVRAMVALEEAILQAMYHGNLEFTEDELDEMRRDPKSGRFSSLVQHRRGEPEICKRRVKLAVSMTSDGARFTIRCEGAGLQQPDLADYANGDCFESGNGRSPMLMRGLMDETFYADDGNEITLVKYARR